MGPATNSNEAYCTFTLSQDTAAGGLPSQDEIAKDLESSDIKVKRHAIKAAIMAMLGGEAMPRILMQVIRFCINANDKPLKKLCMLYWEVVPKYQEPTSDQLLAAASGGPPVVNKMLPEMLLVCNALLKDLIHPNEFVRGSMLRFLCKVKVEEILQPLMPSVKACLEHRHQYVRKNAVLAIYHAHKLFGETLIPDAPELIQTFLVAEADMGARRNAFLMLFNQSEDLAIEYLAQNMDEVGKFGDGFALLVLELTRNVCRKDPNQKSRFVRVLFQMLSSPSANVSYEAAWTLVSLSNAPTAVRAAAVTYSTLLNTQNDNNVKMIVLERLEDLKKKHPKILQEVLMDLLRALSSPNLDVCKKVIDITMDIVTARNVADVVSTLKREVSKSSQDNDSSVEVKGFVYRNMLVKAMHSCASRFPDVAEGVVQTLMEVLTSDGGMHVISFVRGIVEQYPSLRPAILTKLLGCLNDVATNSVMCICLWILGEYCETPELLKEAFGDIIREVGNAPYSTQLKKDDENKSADAPKYITKNVVLSDGTYATQTVYSEPKAEAVDKSTPALRKMIIGGDVFLGSILASCLTKMCLRAADFTNEINPVQMKEMSVKALLVMCGLVKMAEKTVVAQKSSVADSKSRITMCCRVLLDPKANSMLKGTLLTEGKSTFSRFLLSLKEKEAEEAKKKENVAPATQADDLIHFRQLHSTSVQGGDLDLDDGSDLTRAIGYGEASSLLSSELSHVYQLSGFADPVYAEASVTVRDYDISLEILVINRTPNTLSNLTVELSTMGDMKVVERPQSQNIGPLDQITLRASIKVSSTETGHIFGTIVYDDSATNEKGYVNLNDIHMDIMDYIRPATCTDEVFRSMWAEFEWENKVAISTSILNLHDFLDHIVDSTNMSCLTPYDSKEKGSFLAANLYARSVFGEDALVNVSVERKADTEGKLTGYIRIRSKTQGIALSLGDRITTIQRGVVGLKQ